MRKTLSIIIGLSMLFMFTACGDDSNTSTSNNSQSLNVETETTANESVYDSWSGIYSVNNIEVKGENGAYLSGDDPDYSKINLRVEAQDITLNYYDKKYKGRVFQDTTDYQYKVNWTNNPDNIHDAVYKEATISQSGLDGESIVLSLHYFYKSTECIQEFYFGKERKLVEDGNYIGTWKRVAQNVDGTMYSADELSGSVEIKLYAGGMGEVNNYDTANGDSHYDIVWEVTEDGITTKPEGADDSASKDLKYEDGQLTMYTRGSDGSENTIFFELQ